MCVTGMEAGGARRPSDSSPPSPFIRLALPLRFHQRFLLASLSGRREAQGGAGRRREAQGGAVGAVGRVGGSGWHWRCALIDA